jgi:YtcA family
MKRHRRLDQSAKRLCAVALGVLAFHVTTPRAAAAQSPSIDVLGSYFPAWLLCIVIGVVLTIIARLLFIAWKLDTHLLPAPIVYPCLTAVFAMSVWLLFFRN